MTEDNFKHVIVIMRYATSKLADHLQFTGILKSHLKLGILLLYLFLSGNIRKDYKALLAIIPDKRINAQHTLTERCRPGRPNTIMIESDLTKTGHPEAEHILNHGIENGKVFKSNKHSEMTPFQTGTFNAEQRCGGQIGLNYGTVI